eukprot:m.150768 g.150768  ORF g.150768 m.150768 type:complete len:505 (-) comp14237_c0_seq5:3140-4654(-)
MDEAHVRFFKAVQTGSYIDVLALMRENLDLKPDDVDQDGWTAAGRAVQKNKNGVLQVMLDLGLDANLAGEADVTLLHVAAIVGRRLVCEQLLKAGSDPLALDIHNRKPSDISSDAVVKQLLLEAERGSPGYTQTEYAMDEQVICLDQTGTWWPGVIKEVQPNNWYRVHFPGFKRSADISVQHESLKKVTIATLDTLQAQGYLLPGAKRAEDKSKRRLSAKTGSTPTKKPKANQVRASAKSSHSTKTSQLGASASSTGLSTSTKTSTSKGGSAVAPSVSSIVRNLDQAVALLQQQRNAVMSYTQTLANAEAEIAKRDLTISQLQKTVQKTASLSSTKQASVSQVQASTPKAKAAPGNASEVRDLQRQVDQLQDENDALKGTVADLKRIAQASTGGNLKDLQEKTKQVAELQMEVIRLRSENNYYQRQVAGLKQQQQQQPALDAHVKVEGGTDQGDAHEPQTHEEDVSSVHVGSDESLSFNQQALDNASDTDEVDGFKFFATKSLL